MARIISFDCETNGLWGEIFSAAFIVANENGEILKSVKFLDNNYEKIITNDWVRKNAYPNILDNYTFVDDIYQAMAEFYLAEKENSTMLWHMGHIVEAGAFRKLHERGLIGDFDAPYTPIELSTVLLENGYSPDSVDSYNKAKNIKINGATHDPMYDAEAALKCYLHIKSNKAK